VTTPFRPPRGPVRCIRTFPGNLGQVKEARAFVGSVLEACPARETLLTCVSELAANAIEHTASGRGGMFTVEVGRLRHGVAFVAVVDDGAPTAPAVSDVDDFAEGGRGLALVAACSSRWGFHDDPRGRTVWAEVSWPVAVRRPRGVRKVTGEIWQDIRANLAKTSKIA
jgi:serine/threonine-protein kinase RsbW